MNSEVINKPTTPRSLKKGDLVVQHNHGVDDCVFLLLKDVVYENKANVWVDCMCLKHHDNTRVGEVVNLSSVFLSLLPVDKALVLSN